jgi:hypothetical protein
MATTDMRELVGLENSEIAKPRAGMKTSIGTSEPSGNCTILETDSYAGSE